MRLSERLFGRAVGQLLRPIRAVADNPRLPAFVRARARGLSILVTSNEMQFRCWLWGYTKR